MKNFLRGMVFSCFALMAGSTLAQAQTTPPPPSIVTTGLIEVSLDRGFHDLLVSNGVITYYQNYQILSNGQATMTAVNGTLDLNTGAGEIETTGGFQFTKGSNSVSLRNITFDSTGSTQNVTAYVIVNGKNLGRSVIFNSNQGSTFNPLPLTYGGNQSDVCYYSLSSTTSALLSSTLGFPPQPQGTVVVAISESVTIYQDPTVSI